MKDLKKSFPFLCSKSYFIKFCKSYDILKFCGSGHKKNAIRGYELNLAGADINNCVCAPPESCNTSVVFSNLSQTTCLISFEYTLYSFDSILAMLIWSLLHFG